MKIRVTDPCYLISDEAWRELGGRASAMWPAIEFSDAIDGLVTKYLREKTGAEWAYAGSTGFGDWGNSMSGKPVLEKSFGADAGMWCVVPAEFNETDDPDDGAILEFDDNSFISISVPTTNNNEWTEFEVHGLLNGVHAVARSSSYEDDEDAD